MFRLFFWSVWRCFGMPKSYISTTYFHYFLAQLLSEERSALVTIFGLADFYADPRKAIFFLLNVRVFNLMTRKWWTTGTTTRTKKNHYSCVDFEWAGAVIASRKVEDVGTKRNLVHPEQGQVTRGQSTITTVIADERGKGEQENQHIHTSEMGYSHTQDRTG